MDWGSVISAGSSLLGGVLGKSETESSRQAIMQHARGARDAAQFGFNPLTLLGITPSPASMGINPMGAAIADAGAIIGDNMTDARHKAEMGALEDQNKELRKKLSDQTLRPKVPGVYAGRPSAFPLPPDPNASATALAPNESRRPSPRGMDPNRYVEDMRPYVTVYNPMIDTTVPLHPGVAEMLEIKPSGVITAEQYESIAGDAASEVIGATGTATELLGFGRMFGPGMDWRSELAERRAEDERKARERDAKKAAKDEAEKRELERKQQNAPKNLPWR